MDQALDSWRYIHGINEDAYMQLQFILMIFGTSTEIAHRSGDRSQANQVWNESISDQQLLSQDPFEVSDGGANPENRSDSSLLVPSL